MLGFSTLDLGTMDLWAGPVLAGMEGVVLGALQNVHSICGALLSEHLQHPTTNHDSVSVPCMGDGEQTLTENYSSRKTAPNFVGDPLLPSLKGGKLFYLSCSQNLQ